MSSYALIDKGFSFNEIRFIVDSITINKFLTAAQKQKLIKKFEGMCSEAEVRQLISRIVLNERCSPTLDLLENLDKSELQNTSAYTLYRRASEREEREK